jgi:hypothetical protein
MSNMDPNAASVIPSDSPTIDLPRGLALNSARVICPGRHLVTKFDRPVGSEYKAVKDELQAELGQSVFVGQSFAYVAGEIDHSRGHSVEVSCDIENGGVHLFDLRSAIVAEARNAGLDAWFVFGGEIRVTGFGEARHVGRVVVHPRLHLRVMTEGWDDPETFAIARARWRSLLAGSLADLDDIDSLIDETAERLDGDGPGRGKIVGFDHDAEKVVIQSGEAQSSWPLADYSVAAYAALLTRRYGPGAFVDLQVATGSLTKSRKKNLYVIKDRFRIAAEGLAAIGHKIPMPVGEAVIEAGWSEARLQEVS